jgi:hypothetical protein
MFVSSLLPPLKKNMYSRPVSCSPSCASAGTRHSAASHRPPNGMLRS